MNTSEYPLRRAEISTKAERAVDLKGRSQAIRDDIALQTGFHPTEEEPFSVSSWWQGKWGAVFYKGTLLVNHRQVQSVLKIEGVKMESGEITEAEMITHAGKALEGSGIRVMTMYKQLPWTENREGYSALLLEDVVGTPILPVGGTPEQLAEFFSVRQKYHQAFKKNNVMPWVEKEENLPDKIRKSFASWKKSSQDLFPTHRFRKEEDEELIERSVAVLMQNYQGVEMEFMQGHLSHRDVVRAGRDIVMFSNLYWSYRAPFYDAVFAYPWYMLELAGSPDVTKEKIGEQQKMWENQFTLFASSLSPQDKRLFTLAKIERLAAAINLDALSASPDGSNLNVALVMDMMRQELSQLLSQFN